MRDGGEDVYKLFSYEGNVTEHKLGELPNFFEGFADKIGVHTGTLIEWCGKHDEFSMAYKMAKDIQLNKMVCGMMSGSLVPSATIFALKNMHKWTDKSELSGDPDRPVGIVLYVPKEDE